MKIRIDPLDKLFSEFIRKRAIKRVGGCEYEYCDNPKKYDIEKDNGKVLLAWKQLQCSHFHGRRKQSVRYNEDNAAGLCFRCHQYLGENPFEHARWFMKHLTDEKFGFLNMQSNTFIKPDKEAIRLYLTERIKELEEI